MKFIKIIISKLVSLKPVFKDLYISSTIIVTLISLLLLIVSSSSNSQKNIENALLSAQRLEVTLYDGKINGKILVSKKQEKEKAEKTEKAEKEKKEESALAWLDEDFIGPRMPQEMIDVIIGTQSIAQLEVERVSISQISEKPVVSVIIRGLGLSASTTESALELPQNVTLGFSPYSPSIEEWVARAKEVGHEVLLNIPMETLDYRLNDPGPYAILKGSKKEDNITRLKMLLGLVKGYNAIYSDRDEVFTHSINSVEPVLEHLKKQGKYFVYGGGYSDFSFIQVANSMEYPLLIVDVILDDDITQESINEKFRMVEKISREKGYAVVMASPYPITMRLLERWLPRLAKEGFNVAPTSLLLGKFFRE